jgi:hypothetical protein
VTGMEEMRNAYKILIEVVKERVCLGHDIKMDLREIGIRMKYFRIESSAR